MSLFERLAQIREQRRPTDCQRYAPPAWQVSPLAQESSSRRVLAASVLGGQEVNAGGSCRRRELNRWPLSCSPLIYANLQLVWVSGQLPKLGLKPLA